MDAYAKKATFWVGLCALLVICLGVSRMCLAQVTKGSISGSLVDPQGASGAWSRGQGNQHGYG